MSDDNSDDSNGDEAQPVFPHSGPDREEMAANYLPEQDEWQAKTIIDINDPAAIAALRNFGSMFPEVEGLQPMIDDFLDDFLQTKTSTGGKSREEYENIIRSMYGGNPDGDGSSKALQLVAADDD